MTGEINTERTNGDIGRCGATCWWGHEGVVKRRKRVGSRSAADVVDIGVFVGLQFFAAMATVEEEDRVLFRGWFPCIQSIAFCVGGLFV